MILCINYILNFHQMWESAFLESRPISVICADFPLFAYIEKKFWPLLNHQFLSEWLLHCHYFLWWNSILCNPWKYLLCWKIILNDCLNTLMLFYYCLKPSTFLWMWILHYIFFVSAQCGPTMNRSWFPYECMVCHTLLQIFLSRQCSWVCLFAIILGSNHANHS